MRREEKCILMAAVYPVLKTVKGRREKVKKKQKVVLRSYLKERKKGRNRLDTAERWA